jgi:hypothetical protein
MILITKNNQAVKISANNGAFYSIHAVNTRKGWDHPDIVVVGGKSHLTERGARKWAEKKLADA